MTAPICFADTECTGLTPEDELWEFAGRRHNPDGTVQELHLFIKHDEAKAQLLPLSFLKDWKARYRQTNAVEPAEAAQQIHEFTDGCHIIGAVPSFDTERLAKMMRANGLEPRWHYHLVDVENVVVGYLAARGETLAPPWKSEALSRAVHVEPTDFARHTAMGDVLWVEAQWTAVMGSQWTAATGTDG